MNVYVDGEPRDASPGAAIIDTLRPDERRKVEGGEAIVVDAWGHQHGLEGAVASGGRYFIVNRGVRPPAVHKCLESFAETPVGNLIPQPLAKFLVRRAIDKFGRVGGSAASGVVAAFAAGFAERKDPAALWEYVAGAGRHVGVYPPGEWRLRELYPSLTRAVIATRDLLTFRAGASSASYLTGITLVEVGTTNKVRLADYAGREVNAIIVCRAADFAIEGFVASPSPRELAELAGAEGKVLIAIYGDSQLLPDGRPPELVAQITVFATPQEARDYDIVVASDSLPGTTAYAEAAAAAIWQAITKGV